MALAVLCVSLLIVTLDNTILNVALPTLVRDLSATTTELQWIVDAYILVFAGLLLPLRGEGLVDVGVQLARRVVGHVEHFVVGGAGAAGEEGEREAREEIAVRHVMSSDQKENCARVKKVFSSSRGVAPSAASKRAWV